MKASLKKQAQAWIKARANEMDINNPFVGMPYQTEYGSRNWVVKITKEGIYWGRRRGESEGRLVPWSEWPKNRKAGHN